MSSVSPQTTPPRALTSPADDCPQQGSVGRAYSDVHVFLAGHHVHGDPSFILALGEFARACMMIAETVETGDLVSLRTQYDLLVKAYDAVGQSLGHFYAEVDVAAGNTTSRWSKLKNDHIDSLATLIYRHDCFAHSDRAFGTYLISTLRQAAREVFPCADRYSGLCALCCIQDQPGWVVLSDISIAESDPCAVFLTCPSVRDGLLCSSRDIEDTFRVIAAPSNTENMRQLSRTLGGARSLEMPLLDAPAGAKADLLKALQGVTPRQSVSLAFASLRILIWIICGYPIDSVKAAKLTDVLFLHVRIEGLETYLAGAIQDLASSHYSGRLPKGTSLDQFHHRLIHLVRLWHCVYSNADDEPILQAPPEVSSLISPDILNKWPSLRNGLECGLIPLVRNGYPSSLKVRAFIRHQRRKTGSTGYNDELLSKFEPRYEQNLRKCRRDANKFCSERALPLPDPVKLSQGYAGMSGSATISNIVGEGLRAFAPSPQKLAVAITCLQSRLYGSVGFEAWVIHTCRHASHSLSCHDCKVDDAFMRERQYTEAIPLLVYNSVVLQKTPERRVVTVLMWIKVAHVLMSMRNWSGLRMVTQALVFLLSGLAHHHIPVPDVSIRAMRRLHMLVFEKAPGDTQSHIDRLEHTRFTKNELSLPYLGRLHERILDLASTAARTHMPSSDGESGSHNTSMRLSAYEEIVQSIEWYESANVDFITAREVVGLDLAKDAYERKKNEPGVTLEGCEIEQAALDRTLEGYVRHELDVILGKYPCLAQKREEIAAQRHPEPYFLQSDEAPHTEGDVTLGQLLAAIHTYDGDIVAEAMKGLDEPVGDVQPPEIPRNPPSFLRRFSNRIPRLEIDWS
ncbi:hypothetical protein PENSPDRAFT_737817 [Peniophora sp. CONT]|nr:hypothetical protein PENSPDRAFT_737817 [Peniophora sp. CONT]